LRAAILTSGSRTVVFRVSGTIHLLTRLSLRNRDITIAGQTAPGDGICLADHSFDVGASNAIIRYIRVRMGDLDTLNQDDSFSGSNFKNVIIDHCSSSWSIDECFSMYSAVESLSVQWCYMTESLRYSHHVKGPHGYGGIWGGKNTTFHHNLLAHHSSRTPRFDRGLENVDHRNNVIYNWGFNSCYGGEANTLRTSTINMVANYYKSGPATSGTSMKYRIANPTNEGYGYGKWHIEDNYVEGYPDATSDNWTYGVQGPTQAVKDTIRVNEPFQYAPITQQSPEEAYISVLEHGGASLPKRDSLDLRIVWEVENDTALYGGVTGAHYGIIDSQDDVGGWPLLNSVEPPVDTDHDGMPDDWENSHSLNPADSTDGMIINPDGYSNLEYYLNSLVPQYPTHVPDVPVGEVVNYRIRSNYPNPFNPVTEIEYEIPYRSMVKLEVYSIAGAHVTTLVNCIVDAGIHRVTFNAKNLSSGFYVSRLLTDRGMETRKMLFLK
jgi:hypothetical protein